MNYDPDFEQGWAAGVEDARRAVPQHDPRRMQIHGAKDGPWAGASYLRSGAYRDGYGLGFSAERGTKRIGP